MNIEERVLNAYFRHCRKFGRVASQPCKDIINEYVDNNDYYALHNVNGLLACFKVNDEDVLEYEEYPPDEILAHFA